MRQHSAGPRQRVPLLACPAVFPVRSPELALLGKPAVAPKTTILSLDAASKKTDILAIAIKGKRRWRVRGLHIGAPSRAGRAVFLHVHHIFLKVRRVLALTHGTGRYEIALKQGTLGVALGQARFSATVDRAE